MSKYSYITDKTHNNRKIQVESAKRDGSGKNIENNYAKQNGNYQSLTAGLSNNFDTKKVMVDESAYNFRPTATMGSVELEVGSPCKVKKIIGGTIVFNQSVLRLYAQEVTDFTTTLGDNNTSITINGTTTERSYFANTQNISIIKNHIYLCFGLSENLILHSSGWSVSFGTNSQLLKATDTEENNSLRVECMTAGVTFNNVKVRPIVIDLTQMFGSTIADYIYSLEQANAGSGVAWFKRYFHKEYYAYNSGELVSVKTQGKKITNFNQWDEEWRNGVYNYNTGAFNPYANAVATKNPIKVLPNTQYYFKTPTQASVCFYDANNNFISSTTANNGIITTPANCRFMNFYISSTTTYNHDICINFHYDGKRDGEYEPYDSETYPCDDIELRGIPQLDENNNLAFEGDEYANDGNVTRKMGQDELSDLTYTKETYIGVRYFFAKADPNYTTNLDARGIMGYCSVYGSGKDSNDLPLDGCIYFNASYKGGGYTIAVRDDSISTITELKNKLLGKGAVVYPLKTPTDENSIPFTEVQECDNWGTEEWLAPTTDTRPCEVPVGHETDYLPDLKAKLEVAPNTPNENGVYVMEHNASGNSYTPIATWLQANGYVNEISANAIKENIGGALRHQLAQANNIDFNNTAWVDLGDLSWSYDDTNVYFNANVTGLKPAGSNTTKANILCAIYKTDTWNNTAPSGSGANGNISVNGTNPTLGIRNTNYTSSSSFKNAMKGIILAYEKAS